MVHNFSDDAYIDTHFKRLALDYLTLLEDEYSPEDLKKINIDKLRVLIDSVEDFRPKSHIRDEKRGLLKYFQHFINHSIAQHSYKELLELQVKYILSFTVKLKKYGYTSKGGWLGGLIFILPIDMILWVIGLGEYYFYIPIISVPFVIHQLRREQKAGRAGKLW